MLPGGVHVLSSPSSRHTNVGAQPDSFYVQALQSQKERNAAIAQRNTAVAERDAAVADRNAVAVAERHHAALAQRNTAVAERDAAINQRDATIAELTTMKALQTDLERQMAKA